MLYYSDSGVKCEACGKLYGVWSTRIKKIEQYKTPIGEGSLKDKYDLDQDLR